MWRLWEVCLILPQIWQFKIVSFSSLGHRCVQRFVDMWLAFEENAITGGDHISTNLDSSMFDSVADIDLFGMFDPAFDLDGFDACLEGNLNPAFPNPF
jgi:hypothetical protein